MALFPNKEIIIGNLRFEQPHVDSIFTLVLIKQIYIYKKMNHRRQPLKTGHSFGLELPPDNVPKMVRDNLKILPQMLVKNMVLKFSRKKGNNMSMTAYAFAY